MSLLSTLKRLVLGRTEVRPGWIVKVIGRDLLEVRNRGRRLWVSAEMLVGSGPVTRIVHASQIEGWRAPHQQMRLTDEEREEVASVVREFFLERGDIPKFD